jgi:hypothetical protein
MHPGVHSRFSSSQLALQLLISAAQGRLLRTMSLVSSIPPFSSKQWRVVVILLLDVLSVHRLPALQSCILNSSLQFQKVVSMHELIVKELCVFNSSNSGT